MHRESEFVAEKACYYFPRLTVDEEEQFSDLPPSLIDWIIRATRDNSAVDEVMRAFRDCLGVDLPDSFRTYRPTTDPIGNRTQQIGLYVILAHFLESVAGERVGCVSFYSSGAQAAYVFSGVLTMRRYLDEVLPMNNANRLSIVNAARLSLAQMLVETAASEPPVDDTLHAAIESLDLADRVFLKDRRGPTCCLVAGYTEGLEALRAHLSDTYPGLSLGRVRRGDGAHVPVYDRKPLEAMIAAVRCRPPRYPIVGSCGGVIEAGCRDEAKLRGLYADSVIGPLNTGGAMQAAQSFARQLLVVGTPFGARVLPDDITRPFGRTTYLADVVLPLAALV
jgi:hypothetical protein